MDLEGGGTDENEETTTSEDEKEQGFRLLFGGIQAGDVTCDAWENESVESTHDRARSGAAASSGVTTIADCSSGRVRTTTAQRHDESCAVAIQCTGTTGDESMFAWAHASTADGGTGRPPVLVAKFEGRGRGLVASRCLPRGTVLFTERAALACQVPLETCTGQSYSVRACQHCFRSLEPCLEGLPKPHLWPIPPPIEGLSSTQEERHLSMDDRAPAIHVDGFGRVVCASCFAWFCTEWCLKSHVREQGSCCSCRRAALLLPEFYGDRAVQPAVALALRMLGNCLQHFRATGVPRPPHVDGLCGEASDLTSLELGAEVGGAYTLEPLYDRLCDLWSMTDSETRLFGVEFLHELAAVAARNGVGVVPQSPFATYYNALLRACGGRGSESHESTKAEVARALGASDHRLHRGMDRQVQRRVAPELVALFPLSARINHSCRPNAQISSDFVDAHIDLQLLRDVDKGEEITISYIGYGRGVGHKNRDRRQLELQRKYLFHCACEACCDSAA